MKEVNTAHKKEAWGCVPQESKPQYCESHNSSQSRKVKQVLSGGQWLASVGGERIRKGYRRVNMVEKNM
jgi:hypothetical protein